MKRVKVRFVAIAVAAGLAACQGTTAGTTQGTNQGAKASGSAAPPMIDASGLLPPSSEHAAKRLNVSGDYTHKPTGLVFPVQAGRLVRTDVATYDDTDDDVSASYVVQDDENRMLITAYIFPVWNLFDQRIRLEDVPEACQSAYESAHRQMVDRLKNPSQVNEGPMPNPRFKDAIVSNQAIYTADSSTIGPWVPVRTELYYQCGIGKVWVVQYRVTSAKAFDTAAIIPQLLSGVPK